MPSEISYDPSLNTSAGYVQIVPAPAPDALRQRDGQTLLYLLFYLLYTREGRDLMRNNKPVNGDLPAANRQNLVQAFAAKGIVNLDLQNALIDAHIQADTWATAFKAGPTQDTARAAAEKIYLQKMAFITWCLWEDAKAHEFSMGW